MAQIERFESRVMLSDTTVWDRFGELVIARGDAMPNAEAVRILLDGVHVADADQLIVSRDVDAGEAADMRQSLVIDSNGVFRLRHLDGDAAPRGGASWDDPAAEDGFGTSGKLSPGLVRGSGATGDDFFLAAKVKQFNVITRHAAKGELILQITGWPANGSGGLAPVSVAWQLTLPRPTNDVAQMLIKTEAVFKQDFALSPTHLAHAEAFRAAQFSSSNNTNPLPDWPAGSHDADRLRVIDRAGRAALRLNLTTAARNRLLLPDIDGPSGFAMNGWLQLNQTELSPLNGDPPNTTMGIVPSPDGARYRAQAYIDQNPGTSHNDDNLGAWIGRWFKSPLLRAGTRLAWKTEVIASDPVVNPKALPPARPQRAEAQAELPRAAASAGLFSMARILEPWLGDGRRAEDDLYQSGS